MLVGILPVIALAATIPLDPILVKIQAMVVATGGFIIVVGWIIAGILYLTAAGNPTKLETAKKALFACVVGTALVILAVSVEGIIRFYLS